MSTRLKYAPASSICRIMLFLFTASYASAGIFNNQACRMKITFPGYSRNETLTNFQALVILSKSIDNFDYSSFREPASGSDLRFSDSNQTAELNYEIERWDTNGNSYIWVQIPELSATDNVIWAFWGGSSYTTTPAYTTNGRTWANSYAGIWHLNTNNTDSTSNRNDCTPAGNPTNVLTAVIGGGMDLNLPPPTNYISCNDSPSLSITGSVTISAWVYWRSGRGFMTKEYQSNSGYAAEIDDGSGKIRWYTWGLTTNSDMRSISSFPKNDWHHLALVYDVINGTKSIYFDGTLDSITNTTGSITQNTDPFYIGFLRLSGDTPYFYNGMLDEMQLPNVARSSNWLWACCMNQSSNSIFNSYGKVIHPQGTVIIIR